MFPYLSCVIPNGNELESGADIFSNVSSAVSNFTIPGPVCSAIHKFPCISKNNASGDFSGIFGENSLISAVFVSKTPIFPACDSVNHKFPSPSNKSANGPPDLVGIGYSSNVPEF